MRFTLLFLIFSICQLKIYAQSLEWSNSQNFGVSYSQVESMSIDGDGNTYFTGTKYYPYGFIAKVNRTGSFSWGYSLATRWRTTKISTDNAGNSYLTGKYDDSLSIGNFLLNSGLQFTTFVAKIDSSGNCLWAKDFYFRNFSIDNASIYSVEAIESGFYLLGGWYDNGQLGFFIAKYDENGNVIWDNTFPSGSSLPAYHMIKTDSHFIYISSPYSDSISFPGITLYASSPVSEQFAAKFDLTGQLVWARNIGNVEIDDIAPDQNGNLFVVGQFDDNDIINGVTLPCTGYFNRCLIKYDSLGTLVWAKREGSGELFENHYLKLAIDKENNILMSGQFINSAFGDTVERGNRPFLIKYDEDFNLIKIYRAEIDTNGSGWDGIIEPKAGLCLDDSGNIYLAGNYTGKVGFGNQIYDTGNPGNNWSVFVCKLKNDSPVLDYKNKTDVQQLSIFPNPTSNKFHLLYSSNEKEELYLNIMNCQGQVVYSETVSGFQGELNKEIDLSRQAQGIYFVELIGKNKHTARIVLD